MTYSTTFPATADRHATITVRAYGSETVRGFHKAAAILPATADQPATMMTRGTTNTLPRDTCGGPIWSRVGMSDSPRWSKTSDPTSPALTVRPNMGRTVSRLPLARRVDVWYRHLR